MTPHRPALAVAVALTCAAAAPPADAAFTLADIDFWVGPAAGPGISQAAIVIDFAYPGAPADPPSLAWGYRWHSSETRTGQDLIAAVVAADPRLSATGIEFGFIDTLSYDGDLNGTPDHTHPGFNPATGRYSNYWVNNAVIEGTAPLFAEAGHVLPPNGHPFAAIDPGTWVFSSTGMAGRPLADGSWDGWIYAIDPVAGPREPVAALVPEPATAVFTVVAAAAGLTRRRRSSPAQPLPANAPPLRR